MTTTILAPVSVGELFDKITILRIKTERLNAEAQLANVRRELSALEAIVTDAGIDVAPLKVLISDLQATNAELWDIEEGKRRCESLSQFDAAFIQLARDVYIKNDRRAALKREINALSGSTIVEEKSYASGRTLPWS